MRLFLAIDIPEAIRKRLGAVIEEMRPRAAVSWSRAANLHITTRFVGEWPEERLGEMRAAMAGMASWEAFRVQIMGMGWFPDERRPRVLWAGVEGGEPLRALAAATDAALEGLGLARETKPFSPHLTLARIRDRVPLEGLRMAVAAREKDAIGEFTAASFHLYRSQPGSSGSVYTKLAEFPKTR